MKIGQVHVFSPAPGFRGEAIILQRPDGPGLSAQVLVWAPESDWMQEPPDWRGRELVRSAAEAEAAVISLKTEARAWAQAELASRQTRSRVTV